MKIIKAIMYYCGIVDGRVGSWCVTNFLWNTLPHGNKESAHYKAQRWLHDVLVPVLNPRRIYRRKDCD